MLVFVDVDGNEGAITEALDVEYDGPWSSPVRRCVTEIEAEIETGKLDPERADDELIIRLPEQPGIESVRRRDHRE